jgi:metal-responsive CopG/Arc/MetJ family transcriptional regulator
MPQDKEDKKKSEIGDLQMDTSEGRASVSLTKELAEEIDKYVSNRALGFDSRAAFVKEGIRALFLKYHDLLNEIGKRNTLRQK